eukprot:m51a1_g1776 putative protein kinase domain containing protein (2257) ;mRNA; f:327631-336212
MLCVRRSQAGTPRGSGTSGVLKLDNLLSFQGLPGVDHPVTHSPMLLFRFDSSQRGSINLEEFQQLLKYLNQAERSYIKKKRAPGAKKTSQAVRNIDLEQIASASEDPTAPIPMITGAAPLPPTPGIDGGSAVAGPQGQEGAGDGEGSGGAEGEDYDPELVEMLSAEVNQFIGKVLQLPESRDQFITWLFKLADTDNSSQIKEDQLQLLLQALESDGITADSLTCEADKSTTSKKILDEYDPSHTGFLSKEAFMALADVILKSYALRSADMKSDKIGKYTLSRKLGEGSQAAVRLGIDTRTGERKAVKIFPKGNVADMSRLDVEIRAMTVLRHKNIVSLEEVLETEDHVFFIMELCAGGNLADHVSVSPLSEDYVRLFFTQIAEGIKYCHSKGVCHRDMKLENILLDVDGKTVKVCDFGHAGIFSQGWDIFSTALLGSLYHISPEQIENRCYSGEKIDVWALGVALYRMLAGGKAPFFTSNMVEMAERIRTGKYTPFEGGSVSAAAEDLVRSILRPDPDERPSIDTILKHRWLTATPIPPSLPSLLSEVLVVNCLVMSLDLVMSTLYAVLRSQDIRYARAKEDHYMLRCHKQSDDMKFQVTCRQILREELSEGEADSYSVITPSESSDSLASFSSSDTEDDEIADAFSLERGSEGPEAAVIGSLPKHIVFPACQLLDGGAATGVQVPDTAPAPLVEAQPSEPSSTVLRPAAAPDTAMKPSPLDSPLDPSQPPAIQLSVKSPSGEHDTAADLSMDPTPPLQEQQQHKGVEPSAVARRIAGLKELSEDDLSKEEKQHEKTGEVIRIEFSFTSGDGAKFRRQARALRSAVEKHLRASAIVRSRPLRGLNTDQLLESAAVLAQQFRDAFSEQLQEEKATVLLLGRKGSGKSSVARVVFGAKLDSTKRIRSEYLKNSGGGVPPSDSKHFKRVALLGKPIVLYDTSGFDIAEQHEFIQEISKFVDDSKDQSQFLAPLAPSSSGSGPGHHKHRKQEVMKPKETIHVVWYIVDGSTSCFDPFEYQFSKTILEKVNVPVIVLINKADKCTPEELDKLIKTIETLDIPNLKGVVPTVAVERLAQPPEHCKRCGSQFISVARKSLYWRCGECHYQEDLPVLVETSGLKTVSDLTLKLVPSRVREGFVSGQKVSINSKLDASKQIISEFNGYRCKGDFNAKRVLRMLARLCNLWDIATPVKNASVEGFGVPSAAVSRAPTPADGHLSIPLEPVVESVSAVPVASVPLPVTVPSVTPALQIPVAPPHAPLPESVPQAPAVVTTAPPPSAVMSPRMAKLPPDVAVPSAAVAAPAQMILDQEEDSDMSSESDFDDDDDLSLVAHPIAQQILTLAMPLLEQGGDAAVPPQSGSAKPSGATASVSAGSAVSSPTQPAAQSKPQAPAQQQPADAHAAPLSQHGSPSQQQQQMPRDGYGWGWGFVDRLKSVLGLINKQETPDSSPGQKKARPSTARPAPVAAASATAEEDAGGSVAASPSAKTAPSPGPTKDALLSVAVAIAWTEALMRLHLLLVERGVEIPKDSRRAGGGTLSREERRNLRRTKETIFAMVKECVDTAFVSFNEDRVLLFYEKLRETPLDEVLSSILKPPEPVPAPEPARPKSVNAPQPGLATPPGPAQQQQQQHESPPVDTFILEQAAASIKRGPSVAAHTPPLAPGAGAAPAAAAAAADVSSPHGMGPAPLPLAASNPSSLRTSTQSLFVSPEAVARQQQEHAAQVQAALATVGSATSTPLALAASVPHSTTAPPPPLQINALAPAPLPIPASSSSVQLKQPAAEATTPKSVPISTPTSPAAGSFVQSHNLTPTQQLYMPAGVTPKALTVEMLLKTPTQQSPTMAPGAPAVQIAPLNLFCSSTSSSLPSSPRGVRPQPHAAGDAAAMVAAAAALGSPSPRMHPKLGRLSSLPDLASSFQPFPSPHSAREHTSSILSPSGMHVAASSHASSTPLTPLEHKPPALEQLHPLTAAAAAAAPAVATVVAVPLPAAAPVAGPPAPAPADSAGALAAAVVGSSTASPPPAPASPANAVRIPLAASPSTQAGTPPPKPRHPLDASPSAERVVVVGAHAGAFSPVVAAAAQAPGSTGGPVALSMTAAPSAPAVQVVAPRAVVKIIESSELAVAEPPRVPVPAVIPIMPSVLTSLRTSAGSPVVAVTVPANAPAPIRSEAHLAAAAAAAAELAERVSTPILGPKPQSQAPHPPPIQPLPQTQQQQQQQAQPQPQQQQQQAQAQAQPQQQQQAQAQPQPQQQQAAAGSDAAPK